MKKSTLLGAAALMMVGTASAALVAGYDQRYQADDYNTGTGVWADSGGSADATAAGIFGTTTTANGSTAVVNTGTGTNMTFSRATALGGSGFTIQAVIRIDAANTDRRQGPIAMADGGWGGVFMGARTEADGNVNLRGGNQDSGSGSVLAIDSTMTGVTAGTWGVYTLIVAAGDTPTMVASFDRLSDGANLFYGFADVEMSSDIGKIGVDGQLFGGEYNQDPADNWLGAIAEVVVYNSALSTTDATANGIEFYDTYQIPEPATLGLIAAFGGGLILVRRVFRV
ncbi:PEP-CTERM sorting domain-containing protein [Pontiellaceae bacterium B1224]|nr:PEP-CTERM sorting domain-containing protein [Pontiellaceae bacterium B1224]